jgi:DNA-binding response OmpR family regulator/KaiC/GvpD/RAD55 family RecA-like ATPase
MIVSGIEPIDELLGGLERGELYLVHGEATGKSLFGIKFLIEGLKQGDNGALVIRYSPEDAVRRFARLGYDCLDDVYSGRLVILEYSDDIIQKIGKLRELTPVLRELEWLLGETKPERLVFDPVTSVLAGTEGNFDIRAREFAEWARSFGATVALIGNESSQEIVKSFEPLVAESFRFDFREAGDRASRFIAFEKSSTIPDQAIEVDPSRGVFLLGRSYAQEVTDAKSDEPHPPSVSDLESIRKELRSVHDQMNREAAPLSGVDHIDEVLNQTDSAPPVLDATRPPVYEAEHRDILHTRKLTPVEENESQARRTRVDSELTDSRPSEGFSLAIEEPFTPASSAKEEPAAPFDDLSALLDDLTGDASPLELDLPELQADYSLANDKDAGPGIEDATSAAKILKELELATREVRASATRDRSEAVAGSADAQAKSNAPRHGRASDSRIDSAMAARAVELLLRAPEAESDLTLPFMISERPHVAREARHPEPLGDAEIHAKDFNVLIIEDDSETCALVTQTLGDYTIEITHDGVSGLAKLISFKPDLVILDFDLPIVDGFKVLSLIRSALNVPIIIMSGSRLRALDRVMASELGADYFLTKPFSAKELKHKARQLIARYRGIDSWIINPAGAAGAGSASHGSDPAAALAAPEPEMFLPYDDFTAEVDKRVKNAIENGAPFSIVGCRLPQMTSHGGRLALRLYEIVRALVREDDLTSTNPRNDLVVLLANADTAGARAFAGRLRERVLAEVSQEASLWMRSFPDLQESTEATTPVLKAAAGGTLNRRSSDNAQSDDEAKQAMPKSSELLAHKSDSEDSYLDFLEQL